MRQLTDDLGYAVLLPAHPVGSVVSLVPSLTEAMAVTRPDALAGATDWCTHPRDLDVPRVRGTKNPDRARIIELSPELVVAVQEENRELDVRRLREAGTPVWVCVIESLDQALASMRKLFDEVLDWGVPGWLAEAAHLWQPAYPRPGAPFAPSGGFDKLNRREEVTGGSDKLNRPKNDLPPARGQVAVPIWRDPWMVVGSGTFTNDLLAQAGLANVFGDHPQRYPHIEVAEIDAAGADLILLPDEPYVFSVDDGPEAFPATPTKLVSGRLLTWYGPSLVPAWDALAEIGQQR